MPVAIGMSAAKRPHQPSKNALSVRANERDTADFRLVESIPLDVVARATIDWVDHTVVGGDIECFTDARFGQITGVGEFRDGFRALFQFLDDEASVVHYQHHLAGAHVVGFVALGIIGEVCAGIK